MPNFLSVIQKDKDGKIVTDKQGNPITKSFLADENNNILCDIAWEDDADFVKKRIEVEGLKVLLRAGQKLYVICNEEGPKFGTRILEKRVAENFPQDNTTNWPGSITVAEDEMKEELKHKAAWEKELRDKNKVKNKP